MCNFTLEAKQKKYGLNKCSPHLNLVNSHSVVLMKFLNVSINEIKGSYYKKIIKDFSVIKSLVPTTFIKQYNSIILT